MIDLYLVQAQYTNLAIGGGVGLLLGIVGTLMLRSRPAAG